MTTSSGRLVMPTKIVLYGSEGVGKTTFAAGDESLSLAGAPAPYFIDTESGTDTFDVNRWSCSTWNDILDAVAWLYSQEHGYQTAVLDTASAAERMAATHVIANWRPPKCPANPISIEDFGYGKGFVRVAEEFASLLGGLDALVHRGMHVIVLCHADVKPFADPAGASYDRWEIRADRRVGPLLKEWAKAVLFADHDTTVSEQADGFKRRSVAKSWGQRIMFTEHRATHDAKNRYKLPERMNLSWTDFEAGYRAFYGI